MSLSVSANENSASEIAKGFFAIQLVPSTALFKDTVNRPCVIFGKDHHWHKKDRNPPPS